MNKEMFMVLLPGLSAILFALGGTQISDTIKGQKWTRRFALPLMYLAFCLWAGITLWQSSLVAVLAIISFSLGYGDSKPYWCKGVVAIAYGLISSPIGISWLNLATVAGFMILFWLSNLKYTANIIVWKVWEVSIGFLVGIEIAYLLMGHGIIW